MNFFFSGDRLLSFQRWLQRNLQTQSFKLLFKDNPATPTPHPFILPIFHKCTDRLNGVKVSFWSLLESSSSCQGFYAHAKFFKTCILSSHYLSHVSSALTPSPRHKRVENFSYPIKMLCSWFNIISDYQSKYFLKSMIMKAMISHH